MNWDIVRDKEQAGSTYQDVHSPLSRLHQARLNDSFIQLTSLCAGAWRADGETRERTVKSKIQYFWHKSGDTDDVYIGFGTLSHRGTAVAQWLRYCATNRKVADSIPDGVIGNFHWHNPSDRTTCTATPLQRSLIGSGLCESTRTNQSRSDHFGGE